MNSINGILCVKCILGMHLFMVLDWMPFSYFNRNVYFQATFQTCYIKWAWAVNRKLVSIEFKRVELIFKP